MDAKLRELIKQYQASPTNELAVQISSILLRTSTLEQLQENTAVTSDLMAIVWRGVYPELAGVLPDMQRYGWLSADQRIDRQEFSHIYINVRCQNTPVACLQTNTFDEVRSSLNFVRDYFKNLRLLMYPEPMTVTQMHGQPYIFAPAFSNKQCDQVFEVEAELDPCFNFNLEQAPPLFTYQHGQRPGALRPVTDDDYRDSSYDDIPQPATLDQITYQQLPDFCKPSLPLTKSGFELVPLFVTAYEVTRGSIRAIDGPAWADFFQPFSRIFVGYHFNGLEEHSDEHHQNYWHYTPTQYRTECRSCNATLWHETRPRERCPDCRNYWDIEIENPTHLEPRDFASNDEEFAVPPHLNAVLAFMQRAYDRYAYGDIYSVRGGMDISISVSSPAIYGPIDPEEIYAD